MAAPRTALRDRNQRHASVIALRIPIRFATAEADRASASSAALSGN